MSAYNMLLVHILAHCLQDIRLYAFTRIDYPTGTQDAPIVTIVTEDGNEWITDDYIAPRHTPLEITFSTNSTEDVTDDEIISITSTWTR